MGGAHPIVIQSMTDTPTTNIHQTIDQIKELADAGAELVRITINDEAAAKAVPEIISSLRQEGYSTPIIGDFHFNGHILLEKFPEIAELLDKYRINPGNVGKGKNHKYNFDTIIKIAAQRNKAVRIGVNWGSLDQELFTADLERNAKRAEPKDVQELTYDAMIHSALTSAEYAEKLGLPRNKIVLSVKMSAVNNMITVYQRLASKCDYALHLGLTEAGGGLAGITASASALSILLDQGIGDTIRVSLTPQPGISRNLEVDVCKNILQSLGLRHFEPRITSCPGCGRTASGYYKQLAKDVSDHVKLNLPAWKNKYHGVEKLTIAVMGCIVNGPGESRHADIGISLPGTSEKPAAIVCADGKKIANLEGKNITEQFIGMLEEYIEENCRG